METTIRLYKIYNMSDSELLYAADRTRRAIPWLGDRCITRRKDGTLKTSGSMMASILKYFRYSVWYDDDYCVWYCGNTATSQVDQDGDSCIIVGWRNDLGELDPGVIRGKTPAQAVLRKFIFNHRSIE